MIMIKEKKDENVRKMRDGVYRAMNKDLMIISCLTI